MKKFIGTASPSRVQFSKFHIHYYLEPPARSSSSLLCQSTLLAAMQGARYYGPMDDDAEVLKIVVELTPTHVLVRSSDKSQDLQTILRELQNAVSLVQFQLAQIRDLH